MYPHSGYWPKCRILALAYVPLFRAFAHFIRTFFAHLPYTRGGI